MSISPALGRCVRSPGEVPSSPHAQLFKCKGGCHWESPFKLCKLKEHLCLLFVICIVYGYYCYPLGWGSQIQISSWKIPLIYSSLCFYPRVISFCSPLWFVFKSHYQNKTMNYKTTLCKPNHSDTHVKTIRYAELRAHICCFSSPWNLHGIFCAALSWTTDRS